MKINKGYTLAEVLIAMLIIGVLASFAIPTMYDNHRRNIWASSLSAGISAFENAMTTMIEQREVTNLFETPAWRNLAGSLSSADTDNYNQFIGDIGDSLKLLNATPGDAYYSGELKTPNRTVFEVDEDIITLLNTVNLKLSDTVAFECKNGVTYFIHVANSTGDALHLPENTTLTHEAWTNIKGGMLSNIAAYVFIDVNGKNNPNIVGYDLFGFVLGSDGILYPFGGRDFAIRFYGGPDGGGDEKYIWSNAVAGNPLACRNQIYGAMGFGCTARIIENGFKVDDAIDF